MRRVDGGRPGDSRPSSCSPPAACSSFRSWPPRRGSAAGACAPGRCWPRPSTHSKKLLSTSLSSSGRSGSGSAPGGRLRVNRATRRRRRPGEWPGCPSRLWTVLPSPLYSGERGFGSPPEFSPSPQPLSPEYRGEGLPSPPPKSGGTPGGPAPCANSRRLLTALFGYSIFVVNRVHLMQLRCEQRRSTRPGPHPSCAWPFPPRLAREAVGADPPRPARPTHRAA